MMHSYFLNKPKQPPITDTTELLRQIERKDALFRITQTSFFVGVLIALAVLLLFSYNLQSQNHALLDNQTAMLKSNNQLTKALQSDVNDLQKSNSAQLTDLQNHIDCIVSLFANPNHTNLVISDIQSCQLTINASSSGGAAGSTKSADLAAN